MIIILREKEYMCTFCQKTWIGTENTCNCYDDKNKCPNCNKKLSHIKGIKDREVNTLDGLKLWSFNSEDFCRNCGYKKDYDDIIKKNKWS